MPTRPPPRSRAKVVRSSASTCLRIKVTLRGVKPQVWRRLDVASDLTLRDLHHVLQVALGWTDGHLHEFHVDGARYGLPDPEETYGEPCLDERKFVVGNALIEGAPAEYLYDFGDGWQHTVKVERVLPLLANGRKAECLAGARACPPEDCGGPLGYAALLETLADPGDDQHRELKEWVGPDFDSEALDVAGINRSLVGAGTAAWRRKRERYYP